MKIRLMPPLFISFAIVSFAMSASDGWKENFSEKSKECHFVSKGSNPYFILEPGYTLELKSGKVDDLLTVLNETKVIDGVETRIVEDKEMSLKGEVEELTRDYYAICKETNTIYYFGEDVEVYKNGKIVSHEGAWLSGVKGAKCGVIMPGKPKKGIKYYEEKAPGVDMDRGEIVSLKEKIKTPAGDFKNCLKILGTNELEPGSSDYKLYVSGIGLVKDGDMLLVKYGYQNKGSK